MEKKIPISFNEKRMEFGLPVWESPKYDESKDKAIEIIESELGKKAGITSGDFWILMNKSKDGTTMIYSGLIISHNGCLKLNSVQEEKNQFKPSSLTIDKNGYKDSLVYTYINDEQAIYEVGEVSAVNCKNAYPYAMALKRAFDRVVLKITKLAFAGIYSDSEADEFKEQEEAKEKTKKEVVRPVAKDGILPAVKYDKSTHDYKEDNTAKNYHARIERLLGSTGVDRAKYFDWVESKFGTKDLYLLDVLQLDVCQKALEKKETSKPIIKNTL